MVKNDCGLQVCLDDNIPVLTMAPTTPYPTERRTPNPTPYPTQPTPYPTPFPTVRVTPNSTPLTLSNALSYSFLHCESDTIAYA